jgi:magnesium transporter
MAKSNRFRLKKAKKVTRQTESFSKAPGSLIFIGEKKLDRAYIDLIIYNKDKQEKVSDVAVDDIHSYFGNDHILWVQVRGLHDIEVIRRLGEIFHIHVLLLEDILNTYHRQKFEIFGFLGSAQINSPINELEEESDDFEQVSLVAGKHFLLSFCESENGIFNGVEERILVPKTKIVERGADYLMFALLDTIVDIYHDKLENLIEKIDDYLDSLIEAGYQNEGIGAISVFKKRLNKYRRNMRPVVEIATQFEKAELAQFDEAVVPFIRDLRDHSLHILDQIEGATERLNEEFTILSAYAGNRLNDIMRVLTVFSVIFIPITFLAGVYGMNFQYIPELDNPNAYYIFWALVVLIVIAMLAYFSRKKWL